MTLLRYLFSFVWRATDRYDYVSAECRAHITKIDGLRGW